MAGTRRSEAVRPGRVAKVGTSGPVRATLPVAPQVSMRRIFIGGYPMVPEDGEISKICLLKDLDLDQIKVYIPLGACGFAKV
jgi:hypothetical protein